MTGTPLRGSSPAGARPAARRRLRAFLTAVWLVAAAVLAKCWVSAVLDQHTVTTDILVYWFLLSLASEIFWIQTPTRSGMISMSLAVNLASLLVLPLPVAVWIGGASVLVADLLLHRRTIVRALFNAAQTSISLGACAAALSLSPSIRGVESLLLHPLPALAIPMVFAALNTSLVATAIALESGDSPWRSWRDNFGNGYQALSTFGLYLAGLSLVAAYEVIGFASGLGFLLIFLLVRNGYARYVEAHVSRDLSRIRR